MIIGSQGGCTREEVAAYEKKYGIHFPPDYVEFLVKYNGGETPMGSFEISDKLGSTLTYLFGIGDVKYCPEKEFFYADMGFADMLKQHYFPIGKDLYGSTLLMNVGEHLGEIDFLAPEWLYMYQDENFFYYLTDSFKNFLKYCSSDGFDIKLGLKPVEEREASMIAKGLGHRVTPELRKRWQEEIEYFSTVPMVEIELS